MLNKQLSVRMLLDEPSLINSVNLQHFCKQLKTLDNNSKSPNPFQLFMQTMSSLIYNKNCLPVYSSKTGETTWGTPNNKQRPHYFSTSVLDWLETSPPIKQNLEYPDFCYDPITSTLFKDPWIDPLGHTYEKTALYKWVKQSSNAPLTNQDYLALSEDPTICKDSFAQCFIELLHELGAKEPTSKEVCKNKKTKKKTKMTEPLSKLISK